MKSPLRLFARGVFGGCLALGLTLTQPLFAQGQRATNPLRAQSEQAPRAQASAPVPPASTTHVDPEVRRANHELPVRTAQSRSTQRPSTVPAGRRTSHTTRGYVPRHEMMAPSMYAQDTTEPMEMEVMPEPMPPGEMMFEDGHFAPMNDCCSGWGCNQCLIPCPVLSWDNMEFFGGAMGFTGPANRGETGSFGFYSGVNWARPLACFGCGEFGVQAGFRAAFSNFSGAEFSDDTRNQYFTTLGVFRRVDWGLQGGVVVDYLRNDWYFEADLVQIRGELSWVYPQCHELGFWFTTGTSEESTVATVSINNVMQANTESFEVTDLYAFFYRRRFDDCGSQGRLYAGFSGQSDGLIGADFRIPLNENWALESGFTYLIPNEGDNNDGHAQESWNVAVGLVWFPGCRTARSQDYYRPLLPVADNGSFMIDQL